MRLCGILPLKNKVVLISFDGKMFGDNPQAIYEEMRKNHPELDYIWIMTDPNAVIEGAKVVKAYSLKSVYHFATAKLWISNSRLRPWMVKRKKQYYVQTWHSDVCLKKIEKDAEHSLPEDYLQAAIHDSQIADLMISGSEFRSQSYRTSFWYSGEILELGSPKADIFYKDKSEFTKKVKEHFNLSSSVKIALYVPTFRADSSIDCYNIDYQTLLDQLCNKYGGDWVIIVRLHPKIAEKQDLITYSKNIINGTTYNVTNELIVASNVIITDYSGCMFAGLEADIPVFLYASDLSNYLKDRGTYFSFSDLPFPLAQNNSELHRIIMEFDTCEYRKKATMFKKKIGFFNNGNSSELVTDNIMKRIDWRN